MEDIIKEVKELEAKSGEPYLKTKIRALKKKLVQESDIKKLGRVDVGEYILTWHPKLKSRNWSDGVMMIYTQESWLRAQNWKTQNDKNDQTL